MFSSFMSTLQRIIITSRALKSQDIGNSTLIVFLFPQQQHETVRDIICLTHESIIILDINTTGVQALTRLSHGISLSEHMTQSVFFVFCCYG